jgi:hypothetical protein
MGNTEIIKMAMCKSWALELSKAANSIQTTTKERNCCKFGFSKQNVELDTNKSL